jgi:hypothetical protein
VQVRITGPTGSAAKSFSSNIVKSMLYTPCVSADTEFGDASGGSVTVNNYLDYLNFAITVQNDVDTTAGGYKYDLYFFIVNPNASGASAIVADARFYVFKKTRIFDLSGAPNLYGIEVELKADAAALVAADDIFMAKESFLSSSVSETVTGGPIPMDSFGLPQGTWLAVAILGDAGVDFQDPASWAKWDAAPVIIGSPWETSSGPSGSGTCD